MSLGLLIQQGSYIPDLRSDTSTYVYVGPDYSLTDVSYTPPRLMTIPTTKTIIPTYTMQLRLDALLSLQRMSRALYKDTGLPLIIISAYRSYGHQASIINRFGDGNLRAKPGHSEHQLGLSIDVMGLSNAHIEGDSDASLVYQWLVTHGHRYGRHNSYQHGLATDGYYPEKWHRRYLGEGLATVLKNNNQTLTQYFYQMIRPVSFSGVIQEIPPYIFQSRSIRPPDIDDYTPAREASPSEIIPELFLRPI